MVHLWRATLDAYLLRAANVAYTRFCNTNRGQSMSLAIDLDGEMNAAVRLNA